MHKIAGIRHVKRIPAHLKIYRSEGFPFVAWNSSYWQDLDRIRVDLPLFLSYHLLHLNIRSSGFFSYTTPPLKTEMNNSLGKLETYIGMTGWLRRYIPYYAQITQPLQEMKKALLRGAPIAGHPRKKFAFGTPIEAPAPRETSAFLSLQKLLSRPSYLVHFDRQ